MTSNTPTEGSELGRWQLLRVLGSGSYGTVFEARNKTVTTMRSAIKVLHLQWAQDPSIKQRFLQEAMAMDRARHQHVVQILDADIPDQGPCWMAMEFLSGTTLEDAIKSAPDHRLPVGRALRIIQQVASALHTAHALQIVHRDLKPANIFLLHPGTPEETVKVLDFGVAKLRDLSQAAARGTLAGTPLYMSPEAVGSRPDIDGRADLYALGVILFECVVGSPPFSGGIGTLMRAHTESAPPDPRALVPDLDPAVAQLILALLKKEPAERPQSAGEVYTWAGMLLGQQTAPLPHATAVLPDATPSPPLPLPPSPRWLLLLGALGLLVLGGVGWRALQRPDAATQPGEAPEPPRPATIATLVGTAPEPRPAPPEPSQAPPPSPEVPLPGGAFTMGSSAAEIHAATLQCPECGAAVFQREQPSHRVTLAPFALDRHEVTNQDFAAWLSKQADLGLSADGRYVQQRGVVLYDLHPEYGGVAFTQPGYTARPGMARRPVSQVSFFAAQRYCAAQGKRLPSEAEWEFAARSTTGRPFPWGADPPRCADAVFLRKPRGACLGEGFALGPAEVGSTPGDTTPEGVADLGGNVAEWVDSPFAPYGTSAPTDPQAPRVVRGGSFVHGADATRGAGRSSRPPAATQSQLGFRCARPLPAPRPTAEERKP